MIFNMVVVPALVIPESYVSNSLILRYDGIDNNGVGSHSSIATTWKDLSGSNKHATASTQSITWEDNCVWLSDAHEYFTLPTDALGSGFTAKTVELCIKKDDDGSNGIILCDKTGNSKVQIGYYYRENAFIVSEDTSPLTSISSAMITDINTYTFTYDGVSISNIGYYENGVKGSLINDLTNNWSNPGNTPRIGQRSSGTSTEFVGRIYSIRVYDRILSDSEIKSNALLDNIRFMGGNAL